jgi:hypothetical protein
MTRTRLAAWILPFGILAATAWGCGKSGGTHTGTGASGGGGSGSTSGSGASGSGAGGTATTSTSSGAGGSDAGAAGGWQYAKIGGGGFITGGQVAKDGTKFFRTDTSGGYLYDDTTGHLFQTVPRNLPAGTNVFLNGTGCFEAMIAWSDSKTLFAAYAGALYRSTDGGASFTLAKAGFTFDSNSGALRTYERHGQIDPQSPSHVLFGDQVGLYRSTDGGATWNPASGTPASGALNGDVAGWSGVAFNPTSPLTGGLSSEAIASTGGRFFHTTDGGGSFADISSGGPNDEPVTAEFDSQGRYFVSLANGGLWRYGSGAWKDLSPPSTNFMSFFLDPTNDMHVVLVGHSDFAFSQSTNGGDTWDQNLNWATDDQMSVDDIPWHTTNPHYYRANILVDPLRDVVWTPGGNQGLESIPLSALSGSPPYTCQVHGIGIEDMCINTMVAPSGSKKLFAVVWDEWYAELDRDNVVYPTVVNPMKGGISPSWGLDASKDTPTLLARWLDGSVGTGAPFALSGWSADDGATWTPFATLPAGTTGQDDWGYGGELAFSGKDDIIVVSSNTNGVSSTNGQLRMPYYTLDRGATWKPVTLPTAWTASNVALVHQAYYLNRQIVVADATQLLRFYFLVVANDASFAGVYRTDDGGVTWTRTSPLPDAEGPSLWGYNAHIKSPVTGHLWMTAGEEGGGSPVGVGQLWRSTDGGMTFTPLPDVLEPNNIAFGAPAHAGGYPVLFLSGYYQGQPGMWMTANADAATPTWISLGAAPNDQYASVNYMEGDPDVPGRVWVATGCAGVQLGDFGSLLP